MDGQRHLDQSKPHPFRLIAVDYLAFVVLRCYSNALLDSVDVLLVGFRPGQMGAQAIIDVLMRGVEPRGRLAQSWPRNVGQVDRCSSYRLFLVQT